MIRARLATVLTVSASVCLLFAVPGCWNPFNPEKDGGNGDNGQVQYDRTSRMNLMDFFAWAHDQRNSEDYELSLHEDYQFWFSEDDRSDPDWNWRDWIGKVEDVAVTENMFGAEEVTEIRVTFFNETAVPGAQSEEEKFWEGTAVIGDSTLTYYWGDFRLDMHVIVDTGDDQLDHLVDGRAYIYLLPDPNYPGDWVIWKVEDRGNEHKGEKHLSWTDVKRMMRP